MNLEKFINGALALMWLGLAGLIVLVLRMFVYGVS